MFRSRIKSVTIAAGMYRPARWLYRRVKRSKLRAHLGDVRFYKSLLPPSALCFDVGANIGEKSEALLGAGARVVSFEPHPLLVSELSARLGGARNWTLIAAAVGSAPEILTFYAREIHGLSSLDEEGAQEWQGALSRTYYVPVVTLDLAIRAFGTPFYCKIDVEGWELEVLKGLTSPIPVISFEFHLNNKDLRKVRKCLERLRGLGEGQSVNVTPAEQCQFLFERWMTLEQFAEWFPGNLEQRLTGGVYGDIFVRNAAIGDRAEAERA
jgi:FkbM family methyltransferase